MVKFKCPNCGSVVEIKWWKVMLAFRLGRKMRLACPRCGRKSWMEQLDHFGL